MLSDGEYRLADTAGETIERNVKYNNILGIRRRHEVCRILKTMDTIRSADGGKAMPIRQKMGILVILFVLTSLGSASVILQFQERLLWLLFAVPLGMALSLTMLRCERCGQYVYKNKVKIGGVSVPYWGGLNPFPTKCSECGFDFTRSAHSNRQK